MMHKHDGLHSGLSAAQDVMATNRVDCRLTWRGLGGRSGRPRPGGGNGTWRSRSLADGQHQHGSPARDAWDPRPLPRAGAGCAETQPASAVLPAVRAPAPLQRGTKQHRPRPRTAPEPMPTQTLWICTQHARPRRHPPRLERHVRSQSPSATQAPRPPLLLPPRAKRAQTQAPRRRAQTPCGWRTCHRSGLPGAPPPLTPQDRSSASGASSAHAPASPAPATSSLAPRPTPAAACLFRRCCPQPQPSPSATTFPLHPPRPAPPPPPLDPPPCPSHPSPAAAPASPRTSYVPDQPPPPSPPPSPPLLPPPLWC